jgi:hypothetical protein
MQPLGRDIGHHFEPGEELHPGFTRTLSNPEVAR